MTHRPLLRSATLLAFFVVNQSVSADWPMWRHDVGRSGATAEELPKDLQLRWSRQLSTPRPAWPESQFKLQFDAGYEPVCAEGKLLIGSSVDGSVTAFDATNGTELWKFFTDGPVRFAPAISNAKVYFVSDDGCLYCVDLKTGRQHWSVQGGPSKRSKRFVIGNNQFTSMWPARGGVVVHDGTAYFAAGIWPSMGIFIKAVDADTGREVWNNSTTGSVFVTHPHGADSFGSISPQGYLAISGDSLIVPGGRTLPGIFDLATGKLKHFEFGGKGEGGYQVFATEDYYFVRGDMFRRTDGKQIGSLPADTVGLLDIVGSSDKSSITLTSLAGSVIDQETTDRRGKKTSVPSFQPKQVRKFSVDGPTNVRLQAGPRIFAVDGKQIAAYEPQSKVKALSAVWTTELPGEGWSLIAANGRLFATTKDGYVACFAAEADEAAGPSAERLVKSDRRSFSETADALGEDDSNRAGQHLARLAGESPGYAVAIGTPQFGTIQQLVEKTSLTLVVAENDAEDLKAFREQASSDPRYGDRVTSLSADIFNHELPPYFTTFAFYEQQRDWNAEQLAAVFKTLRPYGGLCCLNSTAEQHQTIVRLVEASAHAGAEISRDQNWTLLRRVGPLPDSGQWTHQYGNADSSSVSQDARVKTPLGLLWFGGPSNDKVLPRHGHGPSPQVAGGRLFIEGADMLRCVDVYTGRVWWERDLPGLGTYYNNTAHHPGAGEIGSNYVSLDDYVYVIHDDQLLQLDATTGETTHKFQVTEDQAVHGSWGSLCVDGDVLLATASPVNVGGGLSTPKPSTTKAQTIIPEDAEWRFLAGTDPPKGWADPAFDDAAWRTGAAGFGYGDDDDRTVLSDMKNKYSRVYVRRRFGYTASKGESLTLNIRFDDGFIAYLNGHEVARSAIKSGRGADVKDVDGHEASDVESFALKDGEKWLVAGVNVLAIEGHNSGRGSSDFSLAPELVAVTKTSPAAPTKKKAADVLEASRYASASRRLLAFDRYTGRVLWSREAEHNFRHNAICMADGLAFCIDALSPGKLDALKRRGVVAEGTPRLLALDAASGKVRWSTTENVFGTFLSYSREHDVLLQSGSAYRDRAKDEVSVGLVAYRGASGDVLWKDDKLKYGGPCLLHGDRIITNGGGGFEIDLLTGKQSGWTYSRMYGCNTVVGSKHLLTFRSGAAGFCDLSGDSGTGNFGGFRSSCTSNLIVADGVLNAPDYTRTCVCAYQLQTSLALVHMPDMESWTFGNEDYVNMPTRSFGLNLGAPGDRRDDEGVLWFDYPIIGGPSPKLQVETEPTAPETFQRHSSLMASDSLNWVAASGLRGVTRLKLNAEVPTDHKSVTVKLIFSDPDQLPAGKRVFDVSINGQVVLAKLDIAAETQQPGGTLTRVIPDIAFAGELDIRFTPESNSAPPVLSGVAIQTE